MKRRLLRVLLGLVLAPVCALAVAAAFEPLPAQLAEAPETSVRIVDRNGRPIRQVRSDDGMLAARVRLEEVSPHAVAALLAAEDARFWWHPGIDPLAMARAAGQLLW